APLELWLNTGVPAQAILMVTHSRGGAGELAGRIGIMGKDRGRVVPEIQVALRHPRHRKDTACVATLDKVYALVAGKTETEAEALGTAPGQPGRKTKLPVARLNRLAGLMEKVREEGGRADLHRLGGEL